MKFNTKNSTLTFMAITLLRGSAASIRGHAQRMNQAGKVEKRRILRKAPVINFRELQEQDEQQEGVNCTSFNQEYDANLERLVQELGPEEWVDYICNRVTNEMVIRPVVENPPAYFESPLFGDFSGCAIEHFEHALEQTEEEGLPFLPNGGFAAEGNACRDFLLDLVDSHLDGDGRRKLELVSLIVAVVLIGVGAVVALGGLAGSFVGIAAAAGAFEEDEFYIVNEESGLVLDVAGAVCADGTDVVLFEKRNADNQKWRVGPNNSIISVACDDMALDVTASRCDGSNTDIIIWPQNGNRNQEWQITEEGYLESNLDCDGDRVLEVRGGNAFQSGAGIRLANDNGSAAQLWRLEPAN